MAHEEKEIPLNPHPLPNTQQTIARLVFGANSSAAAPPPPPESEGLLTPAEAAHKDVLTELEEVASSKVRRALL
jgi:hypothetical protein